MNSRAFLGNGPFHIPANHTGAGARPVLSVGENESPLDEWTIVDGWLASFQGADRAVSSETANTYRLHVAKFRWFCDQIVMMPPSAWGVGEVEAFRAFLSALPPAAICQRLGPDFNGDFRKRFVKVSHPGYTPFRSQLSPSTVSDIMRCVQALFSMMHRQGHFDGNPTRLLIGRPELKKFKP